MKRRRSRVQVRVDPDADRAPTQAETLNATLWAQQARPSTDAHDARLHTPCRVCGGPVSPTRAVWFGVWRQHAACGSLVGTETSRAQAACRVLGIGEVSWPDAVLVAAGCAVPRFEQVHPEPCWLPGEYTSPWGHVDRRSLASAVSNLPTLRAEAGLVETPCTAGRCAWCGRVFSTGWHSAGHAWPDGSPAPLCGSCHDVWSRHSEPAPDWWDGQRPGIAEALTGVPVMMGEPPPAGVAGFAEREREEPESIDAWCHLDADAVASYRWAQWGRWGGRYAPEEHRVEAVRRAAVRDAERSQRTAAKATEEADRADVHGFGKVRDSELTGVPPEVG